MFSKIKEEIKDYAEQFNILKSMYWDKNKELKANFIGKMFDAEFAANHEQFNKSVLSLQKEFKSKANETFTEIRESIRASVTDDLGSETIAELNLIKDMKLSEFEIKGYAQKYAGNAKALRIMKGIAEQNGVPFGFTSYDDILDEIKKLHQRVVEFINGYNGDYKRFGFSGDYNGHAMLLTGSPVDLAEDKYNDFMNPFKGSGANGR